MRSSARANEHRFIVNGHTHRRMIRTVGDLTILNAGTLRADHQPGFLVVDFDAGAVQFYDLCPNRTFTPAGVHGLP